MQAYSSAFLPALLIQRVACEVQLEEVDVSSRKGPSFAAALNCGIGSRLLNALVNALDRLHIVRGANSSNGGLKYCSCTRCAKCFGASSPSSTNAR